MKRNILFALMAAFTLAACNSNKADTDSEPKEARQTELRQITFNDEQYKLADITAEKTFQKTEAEYRILKTKVAALREKMALAGINCGGGIVHSAKLHAPILGFIKSNNARIGMCVQPSDVLFEIEDKRNVDIVLRAFEKDLPQLREGQAVRVVLATEDGYDREAVIRKIGASSDSDGTIPIACRITARSADIVPDKYVKAWVKTGTAKQQAVPSDAILQIEGQDYLIVERSGKSNAHLFTFHPVRKGIEEGGWTAVTLPASVLPATDRIVTKNAYLILSALKNAEEAE